MDSLSRRRFLFLLSALVTGACGGGGGGGSPAPSPAPDLQTPRIDLPPAPSPAPAPSPVPAPEPPPPAPAPTPGPNVIERENAKGSDQGATRDWLIAAADYAANGEIEGYASATSVARGGRIRLYVNTAEAGYTMHVYRIGWYGGRGGRLVAGPIERRGVRQPAATFDSATRLVACDWTDPYVLEIPANPDDPTDWASGVYLVRLTAGTSRKQSYIVFTVRDDARPSTLLFQSSVTTWAAYNNWGGYDLYDIDSRNLQPAWRVSFNRPYRNPQRPQNGKGAGDFLSWEIMMVRLLERYGYDVAYCTNVDVETGEAGLDRRRAVLSVGHDEYWSLGMRNALERARDAGVHLGFFGANAGYWQVRLEPDAQGRARRTMTCYKYDAPLRDPLYATQPELATGLWRQARRNWQPRPEAALIGVMYDYNSVDGDIVVSDASSWVCEGTGLANGAVLKGMLGYEVDRIDPRWSPPGTAVIASSPYLVRAGSCEGGNCPAPETRYANVTLYTAPGGALVFATGSMQWNWGLDGFGEGAGRVNAAVQRMTRNVLDRFSRA